MSPVVAIEIDEDEATLVSAETTAAGTVYIHSSKTLKLEEALSQLVPANDEAIPPEERATTEKKEQEDYEEGHEGVTPTETNKQETLPRNATSIIGSDVDSTVAIIQAKRVIYERHNLPFNDQKKIDQVAPLQIQDLVPFDIDSFILDNMLLEEKEDGGYEVLSSLIPREDIASNLATLTSLGIDPKLVTTKASALTGLRELFPEKLTGTFAMLHANSKTCSLSLFVESSLKFLMDVAIPENPSEGDYNSIASRLYCGVLRIEQDYQINFDNLYTVGNENKVNEIGGRLPLQTKHLNLSSVVEHEEDLDKPLEEIAWALGLIAYEGRKSGLGSIVDFRRGPFAYRPAWGNFITAIKNELIFAILAVLTVITFFGVRIYNETSALNAIEDAIASRAQSVLGSRLPPRGEVAALENKIAEIESQLRGVGSLSSVSPLDSIKELSEAIGRDIDIKIDAMNISQSRIGFRGTVPNIPTSGKLSSALESRKEMFCSVKVEPKGKEPGSGRVKFSAELIFCE